MKQHVSVLGAGRMGAALVTAFLDAGHAVTVWNRTASKCAPLAARGARVAASAADAVAGADVVVGNLADYAASDAVLRPDGAARALRGKALVQLASGTPRQAKGAAAWAREHGVRYLDGAIMATPNFVGQPGCTLLYSGPRELFEAHEATLRALGGNTLYVGGDVGHANALDNALLIVLWGALLGTLQGAALCEAEGLPLDAFGASLRGFLPVVDGALGKVVERVQKGHFAADETTPATVAICHASVRYVAAMSEEHGLDRGLPSALDRVFQLASDRGHAEGDVAAVYHALR